MNQQTIQNSCFGENIYFFQRKQLIGKFKRLLLLAGLNIMMIFAAFVELKLLNSQN